MCRFCFDDGDDRPPITDKVHLEYLSGADRTWLEDKVIGVDRSVAIPVHGGSKALEFDFSDDEKKSQAKHECNLKRYQRKMARQDKKSDRHKSTSCII